MKKIIFVSLIFYIILPNFAHGETALTGKILLQVEEKGQAWYVSPADEKKYSLGNPDDAFNLIKKIGVGISDKDLAKIPIGFSANNYADSDADGLYDNLENAIGTDKYNKDSDADGYDDKTELTSEYNPLGLGKQLIDEKLTKINSGKIFLQVEKNGEAWYLEPIIQKRYFLGRPADAFKIMQTFGLGITNADLEKISTGLLPTINIPSAPISPAAAPADNLLQPAAAAIRAADAPSAKLYFTADMHKSIEYSIEHMAKENLLLLANILSGSALKSFAENEKIYSNEVYFQGKKQLVYFHMEKQADGTWLIMNL